MAHDRGTGVGFGKVIVLASSNPGKLAEMRRLIADRFTVMSFADAGGMVELKEDGDTLEANALQKAREAHALCGLPCLADDTGLEVAALHGAPGVYSARYAGPERDALANMNLLLHDLEGTMDRSARFRTVLALVTNTDESIFTGELKGHIALAPRGAYGFGYDPIFVPLGEERTLAEMDSATKNSIGHRGKAMRDLLRHMNDAG